MTGVQTCALPILVRIADSGGRTLGVGLCNYKAVDLRRIMGNKCSEVAGILGYCYNEAVHRDNLLLDPAL